VGGLGCPGWGRRGRFGVGTPRERLGKFGAIGQGHGQPVAGGGADEFQLVLLQGGGLLLLLLLPGIHEFAEFAGVFAIEGLHERLAEGGVLRVGDGHVDPRDDLQ